MEVPDLVVAIFAVLVAGVAAYFASRQAQAARRQADTALDQAAVAREQAAAAREQADAAREQANAAREQANAALEQVAIERARRIEERTPRIKASLEYGTPVGHPLELKLKSRYPLVSLDVRILSSGSVQFADTERDTGDVVSYGRLEGNTKAIKFVRVEYPYPTKINLEIKCKGEGDGESWDFRNVPVEVFPRLRAQQPRFKVGIEERYPSPHDLIADLESERPLRLVTATIVETQGVRFAGREDTAGRRETLKAIWDEPGQEDQATWPIMVDPEHSKRVIVEFHCTGKDGERWEPSQATVALPESFGQPGKPEFEITIKKMRPPPHQLELQLLSLWPLTSVTVASIDQWGLKFVNSPISSSERDQQTDLDGILTSQRIPVRGRATQDGARMARSTRRLERGATATWRIIIDDPAPPFVRLEITCVDLNQKQWVLTKIFHLPGWIQASGRAR